MGFTPIFRASLVAAAVSVLAMASTSAWAQAKVELRYTSGAPPQGNPWAMQVNRFAKDAEEESKGEIKVSPFLNSQLGSEQDTVQQMARGRIDMGGFSAGSAALIVPELSLISMPMYFKSLAEYDCVLDNHLLKPFQDLFAKKGILMLGWTSLGGVELWGKKFYGSPNDTRGVKAAAYPNKTQQLFYGSLGANANPLGLPEWIPSFQTGLAEVVLTPVTTAVPSGLSKFATHVTRGFYEGTALTLINKGVFDKMSKPQQDALMRANQRHPSAQYRAEVRGFEGVLYGMHDKNGGQAMVLNAEQRLTWRKAIEPIYPQVAKDVGGDGEKVLAAMDAGVKACAK